MDVNALLTYAGFVLGVLSMVLHFVAPRTKTTTDDKVLEVVDEVKDALPKQ